MQKENLDAKIDNLNLKKYLSDIRDKYSDDEEIRSLRDHKIELREALQDKSELVEQFQTDIFMRNKDILKEKKVAACNINNLVIHFQTQILNDVS
jgi:vacuolar-type H+-ATPase subunit H